MWVVYLLSLLTIIAVTLGLGSTREDAQLSVSLRADMAASQMAVYHTAAVKKCSASACPQGAVDPADDLPDFAKNLSTYTSGNYKSLSTGSGLIVTYYTGKSAGANSPVTFGLVVQALKELNDDSASVGSYDASAQSVSTGIIYNNGNSKFVRVPVPQNIGGTSIPNGSPLIATRLQ